MLTQQINWYFLKPEPHKEETTHNTTYDTSFVAMVPLIS